MKRYFVSFLVVAMQFTSLHAGDFNRLVVFGDSLSADRGSHITPGLTWGRYFQNELNVGIYENFAVSGLRSQDIRESVFSYVNRNPVLDQDAIYVIWGGTNDVRTSADNIQRSVDALHNAGAKFILVSNLHDNPRRSRNFVQTYNQNFRNSFNASGANIIQVDTFNLFEEMYTSPNSFGFESESRVLSDRLHFPTETHQIISDYFYSVIQAPYAVAGLAELILPFTRYQITDLMNYIESNQTDVPLKTFSPFFNFSSFSLDFDAKENFSEIDGSDTPISFGLRFQASDEWAVGLAVDIMGADGSVGSLLDYELSGNSFKLFSSFNREKFFASFIYSSSSLEFETLDRNIKLGPLTRVMNGGTDADDSSLLLYFSYDLYQTERTSLAPIFYYRSHSISVDGYTETGAASTAMTFDDFERDSAVFGFGGVFSFLSTTDWGRADYNLRLSFESDSEDEQKNITAGISSIEGSRFEFPGLTPEDTSLLIQASALFDIPHQFKAGVTLSHRQGDDSSDFGISFSLSKKLGKSLS